MTTLVTGGEGFLGSHVVDRLRAAGADPFVVSRRDHDLVDPSASRRLFEATRPDVVFHLAAEVGGIGANRAAPGRFWYANLAMGMNVLEECRRFGVRKLVLVGTVCAYPKETRVPFRERDLWSGYPDESNAPYGVAKRALLTGARAYREQYGLDTIYLIPANLYGPRDNFDPKTSHVIPAIIRKTVDGRESAAPRVLLWGDGSPTRDFLYVEDCAEALVRAASDYGGAEPVNLGTGKEISIRDLASLIAEVTGFEGEFVWDPQQPGGQPRRSVEVDCAAEHFGFRARTSLKEGLERTVAWFLAHRSSALVAG